MLAEQKITSDFLQDCKLFYGDKGNPLLAPRGVWLHDDHLIIADTGQNRVFIWKQIGNQHYQTPSVTLGQKEAQHTKRNGGLQVSASTLHYPSGVWSDGKKLIVADAWNHRILIWHAFPTKNGQLADVVLGQPNFNTNEPNVSGIGSSPTARSLHWPYGVFSDGTSLWVADTGNRRVLYFKTIPSENYTLADGVIGKDDFDQRDYDHADPIWPYSVKISDSGAMAITDTQYYRVLLWHNWQDGFHKKADVIIGQENFEANGQNQYRLHPDAFTLNWCYDSFFHSGGLYVADTGNSRLMKFTPIPVKNNPSAESLIGHDDFNTGSENAKTMTGTNNAFYWPFAICIEKNIMAIADTGNHRIVLKPIKS